MAYKNPTPTPAPKTIAPAPSPKTAPVQVKMSKIVNSTNTTYSITIPGGGTYHIQPGENLIPDEGIAKALVLDLNRSVPGDDNNPFKLE